MRLGEAILALLCPFALQPPRVKYCECEDPWPVRYDCVYGGCEILRCRVCSGVISYEKGRCYFPYNPP